MRAAVSLGERCVTSQKTAAEKTKENAEHLKKYATLNKMRHTWKNAPHLRECAHFEKCITLEKTTAHLEKCVTLKKMRHT